MQAEAHSGSELPSQVPRSLCARATNRNLDEAYTLGGRPRLLAVSGARPVPIQANAASLRETQTRNHISDLLTAVHFAGQRLPFRRLQAILALAATGGFTCHDVVAGPLNRVPDLDALRYRYYEALFRSDSGGPVSVQPELLTLSMACNDPGRTSSRDFDEQAAALILSRDGLIPTELDGQHRPHRAEDDRKR